MSDDDVAELPDTVRRYFSAMGVVGHPSVRSFGVGFAGRFRRGGADPWMPCHALQYNVATPITRIYTLRVVFRRVIPMIGHDTYLAGRGRMVGKIAGLVTVADGSGEPFDVGELVTYLNDAILLAPSMLLGAATWTAVDDAASRCPCTITVAP